MLFSAEKNIQISDMDDWLDPILNADTAVFVDPFLIFKEPDESPWGSAHETLVNHFNRCFMLLAESDCRPESLGFKKAVAMLTLHEPVEFCLGYTSLGTRGAGGGHGYAKSIALAMCDAIRRGRENIRHFEELGIFNEGIGADRISDFTCNILKSWFIEYTKKTAARHELQVQEITVPAASIDATRLRWQKETHTLPINPFNGEAVLLVPKRFLRDLPQIEKTDWWDWHQNEMIRQDVNYEILTNVDKSFIVRKARENPESVEAYLNVKESQAADPYDFERDPKGAWVWEPEARNFVNRNPQEFDQPETEGQFERVVGLIVDQFRRFIEEQGGWRLLWDKDREKPESAAQLLFRGVAENYCRANNVQLDREVELGRGPVDFAFSSGYERRALMEVKKLENGRFWNGLESQLVSYLRSDHCRNGFFLSIQFRDKKNFSDRLREVPTRLNKLKQKYPDLQIKFRSVDATPKTSASKI